MPKSHALGGPTYAGHTDTSSPDTVTPEWVITVEAVEEDTPAAVAEKTVERPRWSRRLSRSPAAESRERLGTRSSRSATKPGATRRLPGIYCPNDGTPLDQVRGILHCRFDGWTGSASRGGTRRTVCPRSRPRRVRPLLLEGGAWMTLGLTALPTTRSDGDDGHTAGHNATNLAVNSIATYIDGTVEDRLDSLDATVGMPSIVAAIVFGG
jgi:hypothetical protein